MSAFAGVARFDGPLEAGTLLPVLKGALSRNPIDVFDSYEDAHCVVAKLDLGIWGQPGFLRLPTGCSVLAGECLYAGDSASVGSRRLTELGRLRESWTTGDLAVLRACRGAFSAAHYDSTRSIVTLTTDRVGLRPLYYWTDGEVVVFSTTLRTFLALPFVPRTLDVRAAAEQAALGCPLSGRTPLHGVRTVMAAESLSFSREGIQRATYFEWDRIPVSSHSEGELAAEAASVFIDAVRVRSGQDTRAVSFLSGGMDSRSVVTVLRSLGVEVHTFNFPIPGTKDEAYGDAFARAAGCVHTSVPQDPGTVAWDYADIVARESARSNMLKARPPSRRGLVWTGEGGSVCAGLVHMYQPAVDAMRRHEKQEAAALLLRTEQMAVPARFVNAAWRERLTPVPLQGLTWELEQYRCDDPARNFYLLLLMNDQRRKLADHFENIDVHRVEFQLPFFDAFFLAFLMSVPLESCLFHRFYDRWFRLLSPVITTVPWQTYPGHVPCEVPEHQALSYQWDPGFLRTLEPNKRRHVLALWNDLLWRAPFPGDILSRPMLVAAYVAQLARLGNYDYVAKFAATMARWRRTCSGTAFSALGQSASSVHGDDHIVRP